MSDPLCGGGMLRHLCVRCGMVFQRAKQGMCVGIGGFLLRVSGGCTPTTCSNLHHMQFGTNFMAHLAPVGACYRATAHC